MYTIQVNILVIRNKTINGDLDMQMSQKLKNKFKELIRPNIQKKRLVKSNTESIKSQDLLMCNCNCEYCVDKTEKHSLSLQIMSFDSELIKKMLQFVCQ